METIDLPRRNVLQQFTMAAVAFGAGCSRIPIAQQTYQAFSTKLPDAAEYPTTRERIAQTPYASLGAQFRGQSKAVMTLATVDDDVLNWVSNNHVVISTRGALIVSTQGLPVDLLRTSQIEPDPLSSLPPGGKIVGRMSRRQVVARPGSNVSDEVVVTSSYRNLGPDLINILKEKKSVWMIEEIADYKQWRWKSVNQYWVDPQTRFAWRSRQQFSPEVEAVTLEVLKPYV